MIYTDGVTEACSEAGELFTEARLDKLLSGMENTNVKGAVEAVFQDVHDFEGDTKQADDITVLAMQRR